MQQDQTDHDAPYEVALPAPYEVTLPAPYEVALPAPDEVALPGYPAWRLPSATGLAERALDIRMPDDTAPRPYRCRRCDRDNRVVAAI